MIVCEVGESCVILTVARKDYFRGHSLILSFIFFRYYFSQKSQNENSKTQENNAKSQEHGDKQTKKEGHEEQDGQEDSA